MSPCILARSPLRPRPRSFYSPGFALLCKLDFPSLGQEKVGSTKLFHGQREPLQRNIYVVLRTATTQQARCCRPRPHGGVFYFYFYSSSATSSRVSRKSSTSISCLSRYSRIAAARLSPCECRAAVRRASSETSALAIAFSPLEFGVDLVPQQFLTVLEQGLSDKVAARSSGQPRGLVHYLQEFLFQVDVYLRFAQFLQSLHQVSDKFI